MAEGFNFISDEWEYENDISGNHFNPRGFCAQGGLILAARDIYEVQQRTTPEYKDPARARISLCTYLIHHVGNCSLVPAQIYAFDVFPPLT